MSMSRVLLSTLACLCLMATSRVRANQWCYCDNDLCTTDYYAPMREVCPDTMPDAMKKKILGMFFKSNTEQQGRRLSEKLSLKTFMEVMIETGLDQRRIAETVSGITPSDIAKLETALGEEYSKHFGSILREMDKPTLEYVMEAVMAVLREVKANRHLPMTDEVFDYVKIAAIETLSRLPLTKDELNLASRRMTKYNAANYLNKAKMTDLETRILEMKKELDIRAAQKLHTFIINSPYRMVIKNLTEDEIRKKKIQLKDWFTDEGVPQHAIDEILRLVDTRTESIDFYLRPFSTLDYMDEYLLDHKNGNEENAIRAFLKEMTDISKKKMYIKFPTISSDSHYNILKQLRKRMNESRAQFIYKNLNGYTNRLLYPTITTWNFFLKGIYKGKPDLIGSFLATLPNVSKSVDSDLLEIGHAVREPIKQVSNRTAMKVTPQKAVVEQFCLKVALRTGKSFRLCGHLAAQLTGFNFREGCHYEQILGIPDGNFCRCNDYLCNASGRPSGNKLLNIASMIVLFHKANAFS